MRWHFYLPFPCPLLPIINSSSKLHLRDMWPYFLASQLALISLLVSNSLISKRKLERWIFFTQKICICRHWSGRIFGWSAENQPGHISTEGFLHHGNIHWSPGSVSKNTLSIVCSAKWKQTYQQPREHSPKSDYQSGGVPAEWKDSHLKSASQIWGAVFSVRSEISTSHLSTADSVWATFESLALFVKSFNKLN